MRIITSKIVALAFLSAAVFNLSAAEPLHSKTLEGTDGALLKSGGVKAAPAAITGKKYLFIYFSAHWCAPCRAFTPKLVEFYNQNKARGDFELLFVSSDQSQDKMDEYMSETKMPWIGLQLNSAKTKALKQKYGVKGIPCLVLLDEKDQLLASSFNGEEYLGPDAALEKYESLLKK